MGLLLIFGVGSALCLYAFAIHRCLNAIQPPKRDAHPHARTFPTGKD